MEKVMLTVKELAIRLGISESLIRRLVREKKLPHNRLGSKIVFNVEAIDKYLEDHQINDGN